jgi:hypothetical protein
MKTDLIQTCLLAAALLALPAVVQAQFNFLTNNGTITITGYTGAGGDVTIPATINGLPVTTIGDFAFSGTSLTQVTIPDSVREIDGGAFAACSNLTSVTIPDSVVNIPVWYGWSDTGAFMGCISLTNVMIGSSVTNIGERSFYDCASLRTVTIPASVTSIGAEAFVFCDSLTNISVNPLNPACSGLDGVLFDKSQTTLVAYPRGLGGSYTIPDSVTSIGGYAFEFCGNLMRVSVPGSVTDFGFVWSFYDCTNLTGLYFRGNAPDYHSIPYFQTNTIIYYLPGSVGWDSFLTSHQLELWLPQAQAGDVSFGVQNNQFGFNINWASGQTVVVEACNNLANPVWQSVQTNTLTGDSVYFSDPQWTNYPTRLYRLRSP